MNYLECHDVLGWRGRANFKGVIDSPVFRQEIEANSQGMYDSEHALAKPADTVRILMLGDSFIQGFQVEEGQTAHQVLEDYLNRRYGDGQSKFEVISGAILGWSTGQQLVYYRNLGRKYEADIVLLMFFIGNDYKDNLPGNAATVNGFNCYAPYFSTCAGDFNVDALTYAPGISRSGDNCSAISRWAINIMGEVYQRSRLYQMLDPLIVSRYPRELFGAGYITSLIALYVPESEPLLEQSWQVTLGTIARLRQEVEADGAQFAAVIISPEEVFKLRRASPEKLAAFVSRDPHLTEIELDRPNQQLKEYFEAHDIRFADLIEPMLEKQQADNIPLFLEGDRHWTVEGNRFVAEYLAEWLAQNDLLPR